MDLATNRSNNEKGKLVSKSETSFTDDSRRYGTFDVRIPDTIDEELTAASRSRENSHDSGQECPIDIDDGYAPPALNVVGLSYEISERPGQWWNGSCLKRPKKKQVLRNLCMTFRAGELTALVGNSGSGKTSILDIISARAQGRVSGVVSYKHEPCTRDVMRQRASYVLQADRLLPTLTVRETLTFMAYLKLPGHWDSDRIDEKVQSVIMDMGLRHIADNRIGGAVIKGVSGGEKRRITIGIQLLKDPEIILLDEPTTGLDAFTARHLVSSLADLAHKGKLVLMSIHQPRSDIFGLLDKIAILTVGRVAYFGRPGQMVPYFSKIGYPCPREQNPCDVYIDVTSVDRRTASREKETFAVAQKICNAYANSDLQSNIIKEITSGLNHHYDDDSESDGLHRSKSPSWPRIFQTLLSRMNTHLKRDRGAFTGRLLFLPFFIPFIVMFLGKVSNNQGSLQDRLGVIYQSTQVCPYMGLTNAVTLFPVIRDMYYRECADGLYSTSTFLITYFVHVIPTNAISTLFFTSGLYWIVGLNPDIWVFVQFTIMCFILLQFGEFLTISMLGIFRDTQLANNTTALLLSASGLLASGLIRSIENMPEILKYAGYIGIHKYTTEIVVVNEFETLKFDCVPGSPCITGKDYINSTFPGAEDRIDRNWGLVCGYFSAIVIFAIMMFKTRGIPTLH